LKRFTGVENAREIDVSSVFSLYILSLFFGHGEHYEMFDRVE